MKKTYLFDFAINKDPKELQEGLNLVSASITSIVNSFDQSDLPMVILAMELCSASLRNHDKNVGPVVDSLKKMVGCLHYCVKKEDNGNGRA